MPKFRIAKEKEKQQDTKTAATKRLIFFSIKAYVKKSDIEYFRVLGSKIR